MKNFQGVIIEESLLDKSVLNDVTILETEVEEVTAEHQTPHLKQWTMHTVEIEPDKADKVAEKISKVIEGKKETGSWYADFKNNKLMYVIYPNKVFKIKKDTPEAFAEAKEYGISLGIPEYQVNFKPEWG